MDFHGKKSINSCLETDFFVSFSFLFHISVVVLLFIFTVRFFHGPKHTWVKCNDDGNIRTLRSKKRDRDRNIKREEER